MWHFAIRYSVPKLNAGCDLTDQKIQEFVDEAIMVDASELHILLGKGNGILRELIQNYLRSEPTVKNCRDEHVQFGGSGITIVEPG